MADLRKNRGRQGANLAVLSMVLYIHLIYIIMHVLIKINVNISMNGSLYRLGESLVPRSQ